MQVQLQTLLPYSPSRTDQSAEKIAPVQATPSSSTDPREFGSQPAVRFVPQTARTDTTTANDQQRYSYVQVSGSKGRTAQALRTYQDVETSNQPQTETVEQALDLFI